MKIDILRFASGAAEARGLAVIIDVFRASSTACFLLRQGARRIIPVASVEQALLLKSLNPQFILAGETRGRKPAGFDLGNSPTECLTADVRDLTVVHATTNGTRGIVAAAAKAELVIVGSFANFSATAGYIKSCDPERVSLVAMGRSSQEAAEEDELCARYFAEALTGQKVNFDGVAPCLRKSPAAQKFFDPELEWAPESDFRLCAAPDSFGRPILAGREEEYAGVCLRSVPGGGTVGDLCLEGVKAYDE